MRGPTRRILAQLAAKENFQGTSKEIMSYVEENEKLFADPNLDGHQRPPCRIFCPKWTKKK